MHTRTLTICNASAGSGKTFTLAAFYVACLLENGNAGAYRSVLAVTFTNKATSEMKDRILTHLYALGHGYADKGFLDKVKEVLRGRGYRTDGSSDLKDSGSACERLTEGPLDPKDSGSAYKRITDAEIRERAAALFDDMLAHYDDIEVMTIDSFLQLLFAGLAQSIGLSANFNVEIDTEHLLDTAVDQILSTHIDEQEGLASTISEKISKQLDEEGRWDIRGELRTLAKELLKESVQDKTTDADFDRERIRAFRDAIDLNTTEEMQELKSLWESLNGRIDAVRALKGGVDFKSFVGRVEKMVRGKRLEDKDGPVAPRSEKHLEGVKVLSSQSSDDRQSRVQDYGLQVTDNEYDLLGQLRRLNELFVALKPRYMCWYYTQERLDEMMLLTYLRNRMRANLHEANSVLLAETVHKLSAALQPGDADFILEKAGIRFRHILLDEFQDTSTLQWDNFCRLISEVLASGGTTLIVGDTKQSIYRWRNGNRHLMEGLNREHPQFGAFVQEQPLRRNFRSCKKVVEFNLRLFKKLPVMVTGSNLAELGQSAKPCPGLQVTDNELQVTNDKLSLYYEGFTGANLDEYYQTGTHEGGYVRFRAYYKNSADARVREEMVRAMFVEMEKLLASGVESKDCLILIRKNADARLLIRLFREVQQDKASFPCLSRSEIVSGDSFALDGSRAVNVVINGLKYVLRRDKIARAYIELCCPEADWQALENVRSNLPLTEMLTEVMRLSLCPNGAYKGEDILYLNSLQDRVREYVGKYGANVEQFLAYWDDALHKKSVGAAENNAIRLMTIHKAKGLEAKNVFVPFCNWEMVKTGKDFLWCEPAMQPEDESKRLSLVPILNRQDMAKAGYQAQFDAECDEQLVDNLNLLYVALTRAAERLYISAELGKDAADPEKMADNAGSLLLHACDLAEPFEKIGEGEFVEYETGDVKVTGSNLAELGRSAKPCPGLQVTDDKPLPQPFSFRDAEEVKATFCLEPARVEFRQSQDSFQYTMYGTEQGQQNLDKRAFGTICHDILAQADRQEDVAQAVNRFVQQGIIRDEQIRRDVETTLAKAWQHEKMRDWFSGRYELLREETILLPERLRKQFTAEERALDKAAEEVTEQRPDRVMTLGDRAIVLDYKFGAMNERVYFPQVRRYMLLMRELGYAQVEGYIWAAETNELIEVKA